MRLANEAAARAGRRVDYVHLPVMPGADGVYFAGLADLEVGDTNVYLGIVLDDGVEGFLRRAHAAHRYLDDFGIGSYCGWGRLNPETLAASLDQLRLCADALDQALGAAVTDA